MSKGRAAHGFTAVDTQKDPRAWVRCLDTLRRHPFYISYKKRVVELLSPRAGGTYLDVGAGTGDDARAIAEGAGATVVALDSSTVMMSAAARRGLPTVVVALAGRLPFGDATFDGCWSDRTFQHLCEPAAALGEIVRVTKARGRVVVADPDYGTQVLSFPDRELARRVLRYRAERGLRQGTLGHRMAALFTRSGLADVESEARTLVVRDAAALDNVLGLRTWAGPAHAAGELSPKEVATWERLFDETVAAGRFRWAVTFFLTAGTKAA